MAPVSTKIENKLIPTDSSAYHCVVILPHSAESITKDDTIYELNENACGTYSWCPDHFQWDNAVSQLYSQALVANIDINPMFDYRKFLKFNVKSGIQW